MKCIMIASAAVSLLFSSYCSAQSMGDALKTMQGAAKQMEGKNPQPTTSNAKAAPPDAVAFEIPKDIAGVWAMDCKQLDILSAQISTNKISAIANGRKVEASDLDGAAGAYGNRPPKDFYYQVSGTGVSIDFYIDRESKKEWAVIANSPALSKYTANIDKKKLMRCGSSQQPQSQAALTTESKPAQAMSPQTSAKLKDWIDTCQPQGNLPDGLEAEIKSGKVFYEGQKAKAVAFSDSGVGVKIDVTFEATKESFTSAHPNLSKTAQVKFDKKICARGLERSLLSESDDGVKGATIRCFCKFKPID